MKVEFLWDEDKTRRMFKNHLILYFIGGNAASLYSFMLPPSTPYRPILIAVPIIFNITTVIYYLFLRVKQVGYLFLLYSLESQIAASIFMAVSGGFITIIQFAPYMFLLFVMFELGATSTLILGVFTMFNFICILIWGLLFHPYPNLLQQFFYYGLSYILIVIIEHNIGKEMSLQYEARKKLEMVDDLKNQFVTLASHYLRTPLTDFKLFVQTLDTQQPTRQQLLQIKEKIYNFEEILEKLLTISSFEHGEAKINPYPISLHTLLSQTVQSIKPYAEIQKITIEYKPLTPDIQINADRNKLLDALEGILDNAIRYNKQTTGKVSIHTEKTSDNLINISITDTGIGIDNNRINSLFTTFNRGNFMNALAVDQPGIGLGLYLAKMIIEAHQGKIRVESQLGVGSTFHIQLPLLPKKTALTA